jgi:hypothetical protein
MSAAPLPAGALARGAGTDLACRALSHLILAIGASAVAFALYCVWLGYSPLPWVDGWMFLSEVRASQGQYAPELWRQHNDHRIPLPKIFYFLDLLAFDGRNAFLLALIFGIQLANLAGLGWAYRRLGRLDDVTHRTALGLTAFALFSMKQAENFLFGIDLPLMLPVLGAVVAFASAVLYMEDTPAGRRVRFGPAVLAWAGASMASLSLTSGFVLWPMLALAGLRRRLPRGFVVATTVMGTVLAAGTLLGYHPRASQVLPGPAALVRYLLVFFGSSWSALGYTLGAVLAAVAIPLVMIRYLRLHLARRPDPLALFLTSLAVFFLAGAVMTGLARIGQGIHQALAGRYQTGALVFWVSVSVLLVRAAARRSRAWLLVGQASAVAVMLTSALAAPEVVEDLKLHDQRLRAAELAVRMGVSDDEALLYTVVPPFRSDDLLVAAGFLRSRNLSVFAEPAEAPVGRGFTPAFSTVDAAGCLGSIDGLRAIPHYRWSGIRFDGWAYDTARKSRARSVLAIGPGGQIIGFARTGFRRADVVGAAGQVFDPDTGFVGYIPGDLAQQSARFFAVLDDGLTACPVGGGAWRPLPAVAHPFAGEVTGLTVQMSRDPRPPRCVIDSVGAQPRPAPGRPVVLVGNGEVIVSGWALDESGTAAGRGVDVVVDGIPFTARYGLDRPDVEERLRCGPCRGAGYSFIIPPALLTRGTHTVSARVVSRARPAFRETAPLTVVVR